MACTRAPNGSRTTVVRAAKPAAATTTRTSHRRDGMSATSRAPNGVKPSTATSTSQTPRLESPQGRTAEWYADSRAICARLARDLRRGEVPSGVGMDVAPRHGARQGMPWRRDHDDHDKCDEKQH